MNCVRRIGVEKELMRHYLGRVLTVQVAFLAAAAVAYPGTYSPTENALSDLGCWITPDGRWNYHGAALFTVAMVISAGLLVSLCGRLGRWAAERETHRALRLQITILLVSATGSVVITVPHTVHRLIHGIGAGLLIGGFWALGISLCLELWRADRRVLAATYQLTIQAAVLTYALLFVLDHPGRQLAQKAAVLGLAVGVRGTLAALRWVDRRVIPFPQIARDGSRPRSSARA